MGDNTEIFHESKNWCAIVGKNICQIGYRYQWTLKICDIMSTTDNAWEILVGIMDDTQCDTLLDESHSAGTRYFTSTPGAFGFVGSYGRLTTGGHVSDSNYGEPFEKKGDCMTVDLDMHKDKHSLSYVINGKEHGKAFDVDINVKYRLAVSICEGKVLKLCSAEITN